MEVRENEALRLQRLLVELSNKYISFDEENLDFQQICNDLKALSGAAYTVINLHIPEKTVTKTVAVSGFKEALQNAAKFFGFNIIGKEWDIDEFAETALKSKKLICLGDIEHASKHITKKISKLLKSAMGIGDVYSVGLFQKEVSIGTLVLVMRNKDKIIHGELIELFAYQIAALLYRVKQEKDLKDERLKLSIISAFSPDLLTLVNRERKIIFINKVHPGFLKEEVLGNNVLNYVPEQNKLLYDNWLEQVFTTGEHLERQIEAYGANLEMREYSIQLIPVKLNNEISSVYIVSRDVTKETQLFNKILEQSFLLQEAGRIAKIGNWELDIIKNEIISSPELNALIGKSDNKSITIEEVINLYSDLDKPIIQKALNLAITTGKGYDLEFYVTTPGGEKKWIRSIATVILKDGKPTKIIGVAQDNTEYHQYIDEQRITANQLAQFQNALNNASIISKTDANGTITFVNGNFLKISKYSANELLGKKHTILNSGHHTFEFWDEFWSSIRAGLIWRGEIKNKAKDNSYYWVDTTIVPILNTEGNITEYLSIRSDISKRKIAELSLKDQQQKLQLITDNINDVFFLFNIEQNVYDYISPNCETLFGEDVNYFYQGNDFISNKLFIEDLELVKQANEKIRKGIPYEIEYRINVNNTCKWISERSFPIFNEDRKTIQISGICKDITHRKIAKLALIKKNEELELLYALFDQTKDAVQIADESGKLIFANEEARNRLGIENVEKKAIYVWEFEKTFKNKEDWIQHVELLKLKKSLVVESIHILPNDKEIDIEASITYREINGEGFVIAIIKDITERKMAERHLRESEANLKEAEKIALIGRWELDIRHNRIYWSDSVFNIFEIDQEKFSASYEAFIQAIHPSDRELVDAAFKKSLLTKTPYSTEHRLLFPDGRIKWIKETCRTDYDDMDKAIRSVGIAQDITESKIAEQVIIRQKELQTLISNISLELISISNINFNKKIDAILMDVGHFFNADRAYLFKINEHKDAYINTHEWCNVGISAQIEEINEIRVETFPFLYKSYEESDVLIVNDVDELPLEAEIEKNEFLRQEIQSLAITFIKKQDEKIGFLGLDSVKQKRIWSSDEINHLKIISNIVADALEKLQLEKYLLVAKEKAELANRSKTQFLANMSHEIRTPMNAILGFTELLQNKVKDPEALNYLNGITTGGKNLLDLINDILDLSKIEAGKLNLQNEPYNLDDIVADIDSVFNTRINNEFITFSIKNLIPSKTAVYIDGVRLKQILFNLVGNAIKFTPHGEVKLTIDKHPHSDHPDKIDLIFTIKDSGIGIGKNELERIFEEFVQQEGQSNRKYGGSGLGLSITNRLVKLMNGTISIKSELNKGSEFTVLLPDILLLKRIKNVARQQTTQIFEFSYKKILLVEDIASNREIIKGFLAPYSFEIVETSNGHEALAYLKKEIPDVILLDLMMPEMDGFETINHIKQLEAWENIPIIVCSAMLPIDNKFNLDEIIVDFIRKPYSKIELLTSLDRLFNKQVRNKVRKTNYLGKNALVAEDDFLNQLFLRTTLEELGLNVDTTHNREGILAHTQSTTYDIIFMDIYLDSDNGAEITTYLQEKHALTTPVIAVSGLTNDTIKLEFPAANFSGTITKPYDKTSLKRILSQLFADD
jgi:PAS domain S-box-containing protein